MTCQPDIDFEPAIRIVEERAASHGGSDGHVPATELIPLLQKIQETYGYLPTPVLTEVSKRTGIPTSRMYGVISFYAQFYLEPHGRHTIRCCQGTACHVKGSKRIAEAITQELGVQEGGTTSDMKYTFEPVACLGTCFLAPVIMVDNDYYGQLTPDMIPAILASYD